MKKKYNRWLGDPDYRASKVEFSGDPRFDSCRQPQELPGDNIPPPLILSMQDSPGFFLGLPSRPGYVGMPQGSEEHIIVVGGSGSGKSSGIAKPTLRTWGGAICATDVKGELSEFYEELCRDGLVNRPYIIFNPMDAEGPCYDPSWWPSADKPENFYNNIREIALAIIPTMPGDKEPFWVQSEQDVLTAALFQCFKYGLSFSETITTIWSAGQRCTVWRVRTMSRFCC